MRYSDDEVLIFSGKVADNFMANIVKGLPGVSKLDEEQLDGFRNVAAEAMEGEMKKWDGPTTVPLPVALVEKMGLAALRAIRDNLVTTIFPAQSAA